MQTPTSVCSTSAPVAGLGLLPLHALEPILDTRRRLSLGCGLRARRLEVTQRAPDDLVPGVAEGGGEELVPVLDDRKGVLSFPVSRPTSPGRSRTDSGTDAVRERAVRLVCGVAAHQGLGASPATTGHVKGRATDPRARSRITAHFWSPIHPAWRRCSSVAYCRYARSSRLANRAPRQPKFQRILDRSLKPAFSASKASATAFRFRGAAPEVHGRRAVVHEPPPRVAVARGPGPR